MRYEFRNLPLANELKFIRLRRIQYLLSLIFYLISYLISTGKTDNPGLPSLYASISTAEGGLSAA